MTKQDAVTELKQDEFSKIFDEYRAKIEEITRRTEKSLRSDDVAPGNNGTDENEHIEVISAPPGPEAVVNNSIPVQPEAAPPARPEPARKPEAVNYSVPVPPATAPPARPESARKPEAANTRTEVEQPAFEESAEILYEARREAKRIIEEAEESAKKEAKKRTQSQVDKIIEKARKEAAEITAQANREAEKVRDEVIAESKREADSIIRDITQKYRQETEAQASRAIAEAQEKAGKMLADISVSTRQIGQFISEIVTKAKKTINEMESNLQTEAAELTRIVTETQARLEEVGKTAREEKPVPAPSRQTVVMGSNPTLAVRLIGERANGKNGNGVLFSGQMEMKSTSASFDYQYLKKLKKYLVHIPNIKNLQEYASEKEMSVVFDVLEPLPLLDILGNIPMVDEVITRADDDICLVFKNAE
jgi:vacuolar-type H+-ATPase subunit H